MKIIIDQKTLRAAVDKVAPFTPRNSALPQLENITICANGKLEFRATDLESAITVTVPLTPFTYDKDTLIATGVTTVKEGETHVPAELFQKCVQSMREGGEITMETDSATRRVKLLLGGHLVAQLATDETSQLPAELIVPKDARSFFIEPVKLRAIVAKCAPFAGKDELKPAMMGVHFQYDGSTNGAGTLTVTATNGITLASLSFLAIAGEPFQFVVPMALLRKAVHVLDGGVVTIRLFEAPSRYDKGQMAPAIAFESGSVTDQPDMTDHAGMTDHGHTSVTGMLIEAKFPDWSKVIPDSLPYCLTADRPELLSALTRLSLIATGDGHRVKLHMTDLREIPTELHALTLGADNYNRDEATEFAHATFVNAGEAGPLDFGVNAVLLRAVLEALEKDEINIQFQSPRRTAVFHETTELGMKSLYLLMPLAPESKCRDDLQRTPLAAMNNDMLDHELSTDQFEEEQDEEFQYQKSEFEAEEAEELAVLESSAIIVAPVIEKIDLSVFQAKPEEATR